MVVLYHHETIKMLHIKVSTAYFFLYIQRVQLKMEKKLDTSRKLHFKSKIINKKSFFETPFKRKISYKLKENFI